MPPPDPKLVAKRLKALMSLSEVETVEEFGRMIGVERNRMSGWLNGYNLPPVPQAAALVDKAIEWDAPGLTLDWLYLGIAGAVPLKTAILMTALEEKVPVPMAAPEPPEAPARKGVPAKSAHQKASRRKAT